MFITNTVLKEKFKKATTVSKTEGMYKVERKSSEFSFISYCVVQNWGFIFSIILFFSKIFNSLVKTLVQPSYKMTWITIQFWFKLS